MQEIQKSKYFPDVIKKRTFCILWPPVGFGWKTNTKKMVFFVTRLGDAYYHIGKREIVISCMVKARLSSNNYGLSSRAKKHFSSQKTNQLNPQPWFMFRHIAHIIYIPYTSYASTPIITQRSTVVYRDLRRRRFTG